MKKENEKLVNAPEEERIWDERIVQVEVWPSDPGVTTSALGIPSTIGHLIQPVDALSNYPKASCFPDLERDPRQACPKI
ncbi:Hypothetical protein NTJ_09680 [Nesidiocoris tenuis]|uniref:Uncharacterized protein n=1 Tax=Nesidiocoris tenuis TaxID=355587 RepID=A0ABN7AXI6_9HEMI|nr:Hypothetical protein NTJ_09680 [Nesidiocoris tenuis]